MTALRVVPSSVGLLLLALAGAGCRSSEARGGGGVQAAIQHGRYAEAMEVARVGLEAHPNDPGAKALYRDARVAYVLSEGRKEVFRGDLARGLAHFEEAQQLVPDHPVVESWIGKTRAQLATYWLDAAAERKGPEHLDEAELCFEKVLEYDPGNIAAIDGLSRLLLLKNYRSGMSKTYFDDGLSSFRQLLLEEAKREFQISRRYHENEPASMRGEQVEKLMAEERLAQAKSLEATGLYFAARNEYRLVLLIDPANAEGRAGLDRMDREVRATRTMAEADMAMRRGELKDAEKDLDQAGNLTEVQKDGVSLLKSGVEEKRLADMYLACQSLVDDYRYPEAVKAFDELLAVAPDYKDAALRKKTIEEFIQLAEEAYALATQATTDTEAESNLRAIHVIWPEYKDVAERLLAIEARKAKEQPPASGGDGKDGGGGAQGGGH